MAKAKPAGESKAPLVIALVFFVLTTLALAVLVYMGMDEKKALVDAAKTATADKDTAGKLRRQDQEKVLLYREMLGVNTQEDSSSLKAMTNKPEVYAEYKKVMQELRDRLAGTPTTPSIVGEAGRDLPGTRFDVKQEDVFTWDWPEGADMKDGPKRGLFAVVVSAYGKQLLASQKQVTAEKTAAAAAESYQKLNAEYTVAVQTLRDVAKAFPAQVTAETAKEKARVDSAITDFNKRTADFQAELRAKQEANDNIGIANDQKAAVIESLTRRNTRMEEAQSSREDPFKYEVAHGRVTKRSNNVVYIDIGSSDKLRAGTTFIIQPSDTPQVGIDSRKIERKLPSGGTEIGVRTKGTIEVTEVLGPNLSQARITGEPDNVREGILPGDTLYNAAWRKGSSDRVALFGVFDKDADGTDDIQTVIRDLTKMGIIVDAYYDLENKKWVGNLSNLTNFVIEGYYPSSVVADALSGAKAVVVQNLDGARRTAQEKGIKVVKAREFFPRIGYPIRLDITPDLINRAYYKYLQSTTEGTAPPPGDAPKN